MKKILLYLIIPTTVILIIIINLLPKENKTLTFISDGLWYQYNFENKDNINSDFIYPSLQSKELLRYIEEDTTKITNSSTSLKSQIKESKLVLLSIGMEDFINDIYVNEKERKLIYDQDILSLRADIFINHYHHIIEEINSLNKDSIIISLSLYNPYPYFKDTNLDIFINNINNYIKEINKNGVYLDITSYSQEKYFNSINDYKLNTIALNNIYKEITNLNSLYH